MIVIQVAVGILLGYLLIKLVMNSRRIIATNFIDTERMLLEAAGMPRKSSKMKIIIKKLSSNSHTIGLVSASMFLLIVLSVIAFYSIETAIILFILWGSYAAWRLFN